MQVDIVLDELQAVGEAAGADNPATLSLFASTTQEAEVFAALGGHDPSGPVGSTPEGKFGPRLRPGGLTGAAAVFGAAAEGRALSTPVPETTGAPNA